MKLKITLLLSFFVLFTNAQITDLSKLSSGKFYDCDDIVDSNNNKRGYFYLFETDKIAKETVTLEYVVIDENLNKVTNGFFTEMKFESFLINSKKIVANVSYNDNKLLINLKDEIAPGSYLFKRYRILDLKTNKLSDIFLYNENKLTLNPEISRDFSKMSMNNSDNMFFYNKVGLMGFKNDIDKKTKAEERHMTLFDNDFKVVWKTSYDKTNKKDNKKNLNYINSDQDVIVFRNLGTNKNDVEINLFSLLFINAKDGKIINEYLFPDLDKYSYKQIDCQITDNEISVFGNYSEKTDWGATDDKEALGMFKMTFSKKEGKLNSINFLKWDDIKEKIGSDENAYIKKEGYLFVHNMLQLSNGKLIVICETFKQNPISTNNMYMLELSSDFKLNQVFVIDKFKNKFPRVFAVASTIKLYGLFDFVDYQNMGDDEFLFYLNDNEKNSRNRKKSTLYGIVSYANGVFKRQTLDLKTETSTKMVSPAKKGYVLIRENFDDNKKPTELRLEKINY